MRLPRSLYNEKTPAATSRAPSTASGRTPSARAGLPSAADAAAITGLDEGPVKQAQPPGKPGRIRLPGQGERRRPGAGDLRRLPRSASYTNLNMIGTESPFVLTTPRITILPLLGTPTRSPIYGRIMATWYYACRNSPVTVRRSAIIAGGVPRLALFRSVEVSTTLPSRDSSRAPWRLRPASSNLNSYGIWVDVDALRNLYLAYIAAEVRCTQRWQTRIRSNRRLMTLDSSAWLRSE